MKKDRDELGDLLKIYGALTSLIAENITETEFRAYLNMTSQIINHPKTPQSAIKAGQATSNSIIHVLSRIRPDLVRKALPNIPDDTFPHPDHLFDKTLTLQDVLKTYSAMKELSTRTNQMVSALSNEKFSDQESQTKLLSAIMTNIHAGRQFLKVIDNRTFAEYLNRTEKKVFGDIIEFTAKS